MFVLNIQDFIVFEASFKRRNDSEVDVAVSEKLSSL